MKNEKRIPGEFVDAVSVADVLVSTGTQLLAWANDIAFTDAAFGERWAIETANRMATLSELLHIIYGTLTPDQLELVVKLPDGVVGVMSINPNHKKDSASNSREGKDEAAGHGGDKSSIDEIPF